MDKGGTPYILHCIHVMGQVGPDPELMAAAVLHDIIEDVSEYDGDRLCAHGMSERIVRIDELMTHNAGESYDDYIKRISTCKDATKIKLADLAHNSDITRMKGLRKKDFDRLEKYHRAYMYLST